METLINHARSAFLPPRPQIVRSEPEPDRSIPQRPVAPVHN